MKTQIGTVALCAGMALAWGAQAQTQPQDADTRREFGPWVEESFLAVGKSCLPEFAGSKKKPTVVPADIRGWGVLAPYWTTKVAVYGTDSLDAIFARVYSNGKALDLPIGVAGNKPSVPILYANVSNARKQHNCATMLAANADIDLDLKPLVIRTALTANTNSTTSQTVYIYAGTMISPISAQLGLNSAVTQAPSGSQFTTLLTVWDWYRTNANYLAAGDKGELKIYNQLSGMALYRVSGLTQEALLRGEASASGIIPFFSAKTTSSGNIDVQSTATIEDYAVAVFKPVDVSLPTTKVIADGAAAVANFVPVASNPKTIDTDAAVRFAVDLTDTPSSYCNNTYWGLVPASGALPANRARIDNFKAVAADAACRLSFDVTPAAFVKTTSDVEVALAIKTELKDMGGAVRTLTLGAPMIRLADYRGSVGLDLGAGPDEVVLPAGAGTTVKLTLTYPVRETVANRKTSGVQAAATRMSVNCGGKGARTVFPKTGGVRWSRTEAGASVAVDLEFVHEAAGVTTCDISGKFTLTMEQSQPAVEATPPTFNLKVTKAAAPTPQGQNPLPVQDQTAIAPRP